MTKLLIVNADDFGASAGTNRGIVEAHLRGIVTSTSLLVNAAGSTDAAELALSAPDLSIGLHADLDGVDADQIGDALARQLERFESLLSAAPTHLDTHHDTHRNPRAFPAVVEFARRHGLRLRGHARMRVCTKFYGQWGGETHLEQISVAGLERLLADIEDLMTELTCHPGYRDPALRTSYDAEREVEVRTLCDPAARAVVARLGFRLTSFHELPGVAARSPA
ncbi:MAG TPA: ChbG/HpnK family deacetylase [Gemmatimonadales bacterium]|nr:ChbG/HpnK family deacetylase [Gemmatimonadales bacterium]